VGLDIGHVDPTAKTVQVMGKGKREREPLTLPDPTAVALARWLEVRGTDPGPLFVPCHRAAASGARLTGESVWLIVRNLAKRAGLSRAVRLHGLRHQAITSALDMTGGDVRAVQRFSRHSKIEVLLHYDDCRRDLGGAVARMVAGLE
jgi:integrase/recombinase XerC